jgi:protoporphyrinogen oxidase
VKVGILGGGLCGLVLASRISDAHVIVEPSSKVVLPTMKVGLILFFREMKKFFQK